MSTKIGRPIYHGKKGKREISQKKSNIVYGWNIYSSAFQAEEKRGIRAFFGVDDRGTGVCPICMLKIDENYRTSFMDVPFPKHFRSLVSTIISRNTKSVDHLLEKFSKYRKNIIRLHKMDNLKTNIYIPFFWIIFKSWSAAWATVMNLGGSNIFLSFIIFSMLLSATLISSKHNVWKPLSKLVWNKGGYQYFSMKADIHILNSNIKSKNLFQSIRKKPSLYKKKQAEIAWSAI